MGEIRPKKCEGRELTKDQLAKVRNLRTVRPFEIREVKLADAAGVDLRKPETIEVRESGRI